MTPPPPGPRHAYDDVLANVFFSPGTEDISPSIGAERRGRGAKRRGPREASPAATDFKLFDDRPHLTAALDGWSDVADYALTWTAGHSG